MRALLRTSPVLLAASMAQAQWWWPPTMTVSPACIDPNTSISINLQGQYPDACPPNTYEIVRSGFEIDINTRREPPPTFCLTVITNWSMGIAMQPLPVGTYTVYGRHYGPAGPLSERALLGTIQVVASCGSTCYPNCDGSTQPPILNVQDFTCFLQRYAAGESYANCDQSTIPPVLNVQDFTCFLQRYAAGCR